MTAPTGRLPCPACLRYPCACPGDIMPGREVEARKPEAKLSGEVIGYRTWRLAQWRVAGGEPIGLWSNGIGNLKWQPGVNEATCEAPFPYTPPHQSPHHHCGCGLYAFHGPGLARQVVDLDAAATVAGVVKAWGRMEVHHKGFRTQFAQIVVIAVPESLDARYRAALRELAMAFGARFVALDELEAAGREFGDPVAHEHRPATPLSGHPLPLHLGPGPGVPKFHMGRWPQPSGPGPVAMTQMGSVANRAGQIPVFMWQVNEPPPKPSLSHFLLSALAGFVAYLATVALIVAVIGWPWWLGVVLGIAAQFATMELFSRPRRKLSRKDRPKGSGPP